MMARPKRKAPARGDAPGLGGRFMGFEKAGLQSTPLATAAQLIAARHCLPLERAALVAVLALGGAHGR